MKTIPLTRGMVALVDDDDYEALARFKWCASVSGGLTKIYHATRRAGDRIVYMHRAILDAPAGVKVDHKNGDGCDNQRSNLRFATSAQNNANHVRLSPRNTSGYRGVSWNTARGQWKAFISSGNKTVGLGIFATPIDAAKAYDQAALAARGEFARLNFPEDRRAAPSEPKP